MGFKNEHVHGKKDAGPEADAPEIEKALPFLDLAR